MESPSASSAAAAPALRSRILRALLRWGGPAAYGIGLLTVAGSDRFALSEPAEQVRLLDAWGSALTALGADPRITRLQWVERAAPEDRDVAAWTRQRISGTDDAVADYLHLVDDVASQSARHDVWLAVGVDRSVGLGSMPSVLRDVAARLLPARLVAQTATAQDAGELLRRCLDGPSIRHVPTQQLRLLSEVEGWEQVRVDDCVHRAFAVTGWPRLPLSPGWLEPLFLAAPAGVARTVSVHLHPVPAAEAMRRARSARSRAQLDASDRARFGLVDSARSRRTPPKPPPPRRNSWPGIGCTGSPPSSRLPRRRSRCSRTAAARCGPQPKPPGWNCGPCTASTPAG